MLSLRNRTGRGTLGSTLLLSNEARIEVVHNLHIHNLLEYCMAPSGPAAMAACSA